MRAQCKSITLEQFQNSYHQIAPYCKDSYEDVIQRIRNIHTVKRQGVLQGKEKKKRIKSVNYKNSLAQCGTAQDWSRCGM